ncbi:UbiH 2-polyprenyl-6-methoxyphenol hydroxylase and related FAD-dependent oxidoreductases [Candidatus Pelagibacterales bacterium]
MLNSQKICIIGSGLTGLMIAYLLSKFRLQIDIVEQDFNKKKIKPTKIALSKSSLDELCCYGLKDIKKKSNIIKNIYLHDSYSSISLKQDLHFSVSNKKEALAYIIDSNTLFSDIYKKLKSLNNINFLNKEISSINDEKFFKEITFKDLIKKNYNLIIFASANNLSLLSKFKLRKVVDKSYNEDAYVFNLFHEKILNNSARQFFLKDGPLAFLPVSSTETSVIWSIKNNSINKKYVSNKKYLSKFFNNHFKELFKEIISISEINKFNLNYSFNELKDSKRTLLFGEIANKIHPIAGQGWNMTLRNIFSLIKVIKYSINLGLEIGNDIFIKKYLDETNLNNLAFATLIDGIRKIFDIRIDSYATLRKNTLSNLDKNFFIKKNFINIANKGLFI